MFEYGWRWEGYAFSHKEMEVCRTSDGNLSHILKKKKNKTNPKEKNPMTHLTLLIFFSASSRLYSIMDFIHVQIHKKPQNLSGIKNCGFLLEVFSCSQVSVSALPPDPWVLQPWFSTEAAGHPSSGNPTEGELCLNFLLWANINFSLRKENVSLLLNSIALVALDQISYQQVLISIWK